MALVVSWLCCSVTSYIRMLLLSVWSSNSVMMAMRSLTDSFAAVSVFLIFSRSFSTYYKWREQNSMCDKYLRLKAKRFYFPLLLRCNSVYTNRFLITALGILVLLSTLPWFMSIKLYIYVLNVAFTLITIYGSVGLVLTLFINDALAVRAEMIIILAVVLLLFPTEIMFPHDEVIRNCTLNLLTVFLALVNVIVPLVKVFRFQQKSLHYKWFEFLGLTCTYSHESYLPEAKTVTNLSTPPIGLLRPPSIAISISSSETSQTQYPVRLIDFLKRGQSEYITFAEFLVQCFASE
ncbi:hypothetical protein RFI_21259, partial [Reticulomyxa filosa]